MPALLSVRARGSAGAADRSRGVLRGDRQRRRAAGASRRRLDRTRWRDGLSLPARIAGDDQDGRPCRVLPAQDHAAGRAARGTARAIAGLSPYVAGKTGTSDDENDAWFVGFSNDVTVAVWIGYDNADGKRRPLGGGATGGHVAVPIFEPVIQAVWAHVAPKAALAPPSQDAKRQLTCKSMDWRSGEIQNSRGKPI